MSLQTRLSSFISAVGADVKDLKRKTSRLELNGSPECVIVGSSNAISTAWGPEFCAAWGLTMRNFAISGSAFTNTGNFLTQLQSAAADSSFSNSEVSLVVICDASNNIRSWNNTGSTTDVTVDAKATFAYAKTTFPNARVVCIPVIWPADPINNITGVPGGYQYVWPRALLATVQMINDAAMEKGVEVVDQSWTWLSGLTGVMNSDGSVHPNAAGYTLVAQWLSRHIRGESTRKDTNWAMIPLRNATFFTTPITAGSAPLMWRREGWTIFIQGTVKITVTSSNPTDFADLPAGIRPPYDWIISYRTNGQGPVSTVQLYNNGVMRIWGALAANTEFYVHGVFTLS